MTLINRKDLLDQGALAAKLSSVDVVYHLAAVNRGVPENELVTVNRDITQSLIRGIEQLGKPITIIFANSTHSEAETSTFGASKRGSAEKLKAAASRLGSPMVDIILPNVFGEHGRPDYNSFVATFCHRVSNRETAVVMNDRALPLMHAQDAADLLIDLGEAPQNQVVRPEVPVRTISEVLQLVEEVAEDYRTGQLPDLADMFTRDIFNTYRSYAFPAAFPLFPDAMTDPRGRLVEAVRARGGQAQVFFSSTRPGMTRGEHFHLRKVERFMVLQGTAEIRLRRLFSSEVISFKVGGDRPAIVDMPTMWAHSITNTGDSDLITLFWADQVFNPLDPDTFHESV